MQVFLTSVSSVVEIVLIMALGYILRRNNWFADSENLQCKCNTFKKENP